MAVVEPEIGGLHAIGVDDIEKSGGCKQYGNITILLRHEDSGEERGQQIIQEPAEDVAETIPESLRGQFLYTAQKLRFRQKYGEPTICINK
jgi:hypothetical protein